MIGLASGTVRLAPYTKAWARLFAKEKARLEVAVGRTVLDIQLIERVLTIVRLERCKGGL